MRNRRRHVYNFVGSTGFLHRTANRNSFLKRLGLTAGTLSSA